MMSRTVSSPHRLSRTSVTAVVIAAIVFVAGAVNISSAWFGIDPARVRILRLYHLLPGPHSSRTLTVLAGMLLMLLSFSLFRRKRQGWIAAVVLLSVSLALHLLKGLDYEEAIFTALVLGVLLGARHEFVVRSDRCSFRSAGMISADDGDRQHQFYGMLGFALLRGHFEPRYTPDRGVAINADRVAANRHPGAAAALITVVKVFPRTRRSRRVRGAAAALPPRHRGASSARRRIATRSGSMIRCWASLSSASLPLPARCCAR